MSRLRRKGQKKAPSGVESARLKSLEAEMRKENGAARLAREKRRDSRIDEEDKVLIELLTNGRPPADKTIINALTKDVSPGGVRLLTDVLLPVDTLLKMEIVLSQRRRQVHAMGVVRWAHSMYEEEMFEIGIEFTQISPDDKMLLLEHTYKKRG
jgi:c-di-GMP-binding flagellar brake protein YcgR